MSSSALSNSRVTRVDNPRNKSHELHDRSIGIIPGLIRTTYRSGKKISSAVTQSSSAEMVATHSPELKSKVKVDKVEGLKIPVYQLDKGFTPSEMPGSWKQSVESLTSGMEALGVGEAGVEMEEQSGGSGVGSSDEDREEAAKPWSDEHVAFEPTSGIGHGQATQLVAEDTKTPSGDESLLALDNLPINFLQFHPFQRLPPEIRLKIWGLAARHERIIVIEAIEKPGLDWVGDPNHAEAVLHSRSSIPPLLRVNQEAYGECRSLYSTRRYNCMNSVLYNPRTDILYFTGARLCLHVLQLAFWRIENDTPRVAIDIGNPIGKCCANRTPLVGNVMRSLHGYVKKPSEDHPDGRLFHCKGLKEVLLMMGSGVLGMAPSCMNPSVCFRPARTIGITKSQALVKIDFEVEIAKIADEKPSLFGRNAWVGDDKPTFSFVDLARDKAGEVFETLPVSRSEVLDLKVHSFAFIGDLRQSTGCKIILPHEKDDEKAWMEIGIKGSKEGVEVCRSKIQDMIILRI